jgi:hypothetical protein
MTDRTVAARIASGIAFGVVVLYALTSLAYVAPDSGFKSATAGLANLGRPYFSQTWTLFAPSILKSNVELHINAQWRDESGELVEGGWFSATDLELAAVAGQPLPSRAVKQSWNLIRDYNSRFFDLNEEQRAYVRDAFIDAVPGGFGARSEEDLLSDLEALGANRTDVLRLLRYDYVLKEYATYLATAYFGEEIVRVRWRAWYERPNSFEQRHSPEQQYADESRSFGWRQSTDAIRPDALAAYVRMVEKGGGAK